MLIAMAPTEVLSSGQHRHASAGCGSESGSATPQLPHADSVGVVGRESQRLAVMITQPHTGAPYDAGSSGLRDGAFRHWKERSTL